MAASVFSVGSRAMEEEEQESSYQGFEGSSSLRT